MKTLVPIIAFLVAGTAHAQSSASVNVGTPYANGSQFIGTNNVGSNAAFAGPNPYYDLTQFGLYTNSGTPPIITCSITRERPRQLVLAASVTLRKGKEFPF